MHNNKNLNIDNNKEINKIKLLKFRKMPFSHESSWRRNEFVYEVARSLAA
jgi:hypothetical protein